VTATIMKQGSNQAIRFFVMESLKDWYRGGDPNKPVNKILTGMFGAVAGAASVFGNTPIDVVKTRMQVSVSYLSCLQTKLYLLFSFSC
jgi:tricarboxylate transport protein, mitochondrial